MEPLAIIYFSVWLEKPEKVKHYYNFKMLNKQHNQKRNKKI